MSICSINNILFKKLLIFFIIFLICSCSSLKKNEDFLSDEIIIDSDNYIKEGNIKSFNFISNYWESQNHKSYEFNYDLIEYAKINFGKGKRKYSTLISNPILIDNHIYLVDNEAQLTKFNISSKNIEWKKIINENIQINVAWPASLVATDESIIVTTGEGSINSLDFDGNLIWSKNYFMSIRTPSYNMNELIVILKNDGELIALDKSNGEEKWKINKDSNKISSIYGGRIYEYRNNLIVTSPKRDLYFIDNFFNEFSELENYFHKEFDPINKDNFDYDIKISTFKNYLILIENKKFYSVYDLINNNFFIKRSKLPENKYLTNINNSIILLDNMNQIISINIENGKMFWKSDIDKHISSKNKIINILESKNEIIIFTDNGLCLFLNKKNGMIEKKQKLKINNVNAIYLYDEYILYVTEKSRLHIYK
tara:strand:+ start:1280 stop:2554 length:1275 start_codon:yes stop_codon:yes gene_type:complete